MIGSDRERRSTTLFIGNLPYTFRERDVADYFERCGRIKNITVGVNPRTGQSKGYAFVEFEDRRDAEDAYERFDNYSLEGRRLRLDWDIGLDRKLHTRRRRPSPRHHFRPIRRGGHGGPGGYSPRSRYSRSPRGRRSRSPGSRSPHRHSQDHSHSHSHSHSRSRSHSRSPSRSRSRSRSGSGSQTPPGSPSRSPPHQRSDTHNNTTPSHSPSSRGLVLSPASCDNSNDDKMKIEKKTSPDDPPQQQKVRSSEEEKTRRERSPHRSQNDETESKRNKNPTKEIESEDQSLDN